MSFADVDVTLKSKYIPFHPDIKVRRPSGLLREL